MSIQNPQQWLQSSVLASDTSFVLPFTTIDSTLLPLVGGKAANLGEMIHAGLPVPPGFCVTTTSYALAAESAGLKSILDELASTRVDEVTHLERSATSLTIESRKVHYPCRISSVSSPTKKN